MEITYLNNQAGNHHFNVNGTVIVLWNSGRSLLSLNHFNESFDFNKKMFDEGNVSQMTAFIENNEDFIKQYIKTATAANELRQSYLNIPVKRLVGVNSNNEIVITKVDLSRGYVSVTADTISPVKEKQLIAWNKENLVEHFMCEEGLKRRAAVARFEEILRYDGIHTIADISLFSDSFTYNKSEYYFESVGCGAQHETIANLHPELKPLIDLHLKKDTADMLRAVYMVSQLPATDYKKEVINHGRKLVSKKK